MIDLSRATRRRIRALFPQSAWPEVESLLKERCGENLPFIESSHHQLAERIRCSVLKLSGGDLAALRHQIEGAQVDWRDTLVVAGFDNSVAAHLRWKPWGSR
jgi:hypothetical protein